MDLSTSPLRRGLAPALLGTALACSTVLASGAVAHAAGPLLPIDPRIVLVGGQPALGHSAGKDIFQIGSGDVPVAVVSEDGRLAIHDDGGSLLCTDDDYDASVDECPVHLEPGEHVLTATVTTPDGAARTSAPVLVQALVDDEQPGGEDGAGDGQGPAAPTVVDAVPGPWPGTTTATLGGAAGDEVVVRQEQHGQLASGPFDADGRFTVDVPTDGSPLTVTVETRRGDQRLETELVVPDASTAPVVARPLELVGAERTTAGSVDATFRGTPGTRYQLTTTGRTAETSGTVPEDGLVTWTVPLRTPQQSSVSVGAHVFGDLDQQDVSYLTIDVPPLEAEPVVADEAPGEVDPGFTAPGDEADATLQASLVATNPGYGGTAFVRLVDPSAQGHGYWAQVRVDGRTVDAVRIGDQESVVRIKGLGAGGHVLDFVRDGRVLATVSATL